MIQQIGEKISDHHLIAYLCNIFIFLVYPRRNITFWKWAISNNRSFLHMLFKEDVLGRARYRHVNVKKVSVCVVCVEYDFFFYKNKTIFFFSISFPSLLVACHHSLPFKLAGSAFLSYLKRTNSQLEGHWMSKDSQIRQSLTC